MNIKIVTDSSADILELEGVKFESVPLKIITAKQEYVDSSELDVYTMTSDLKNYNGRSSTSCPNVNDWLSAFENAERVICVTLTSGLSGSYNAACQAKLIYEQDNPDCKVFVLDSLSAGPELGLVVQKVAQLVAEGEEFDSICKQITSYSKKTGLLFVLESLKNLANNGRVNPLVAKMAGMLGIRAVGKASDKGEFEMLGKARGEASALSSVVEHLKEFGLEHGKVRIGHCYNEKAAKMLKDLILAKLPKAQVELYSCRGLCSFYAEMGGLLIGYEKC